MGQKHTRALRNLALSPAVGAGCVLGGALLGAACVVGGTAAGLTAPVWYTRRGYRQGKEMDEMEELLGPAPKRSRGKKTKSRKPITATAQETRNTLRKQAAAALRAGAGVVSGDSVLMPVPKALAQLAKNLSPEMLEKLQAFAQLQAKGAAGG